MKKLAAQDVPTRFATVLAARPKGGGQPSDLEHRLQSECRVLRVVEKLHGGAHLLIPKVGAEGDTSSLALRVYHECDPPLLPPSKPVRSSHETQTATSSHVAQKHSSDVEDLANFFRSFKLTAVFFLLPTPSIQMAQLNNPHSFFHKAQTLVHPRLGHATTTSSHAIKGRISLVHMVPDADAALSVLISLVSSFKKQETNAAAQVQHQWPPPRDLLRIPEWYRTSAALQVANAIHQWGIHFEIPPEDIKVLMSRMKTLDAISKLSVDDLQELPVENRTKSIVIAFFGNDGEALQLSQSSFSLAGSEIPADSPIRDDCRSSGHITGAISLSNWTEPHIVDPPRMQYRTSVSSSTLGILPPPTIQRNTIWDNEPNLPEMSPSEPDPFMYPYL